ncbi:hypothetical protein [Streptomyces caniscabiei]|uniref:Uncharacterized protein n=1 Tax=Streptomyces caniscabiei TaxID=2746961 RepID=A0A927L8Q8_9ACTN|nr:hypothetical protein [Streptomyces caniscabiei]MBD9727309.1 hypothetical protein [Streptomyces caniscabiei]MDX3512343.1 hypothetical protein [Streptomyces caniscabiei]MDX3721594.1 hypothetical protein [Streptomyces caniscabiei]WEO26332.1 hypothetical protein IHE65_25980 [Streptomyces caniscabiei]
MPRHPSAADFPVSWSSHLDNADVAAALFDRPDITGTIAVVQQPGITSPDLAQQPVPAWTSPAPTCPPPAAKPSPHNATSKTCAPSPADRARTTPDHDRVTDAGQQAAAASRKSIRPPLP